jgi:hypothetical protein
MGSRNSVEVVFHLFVSATAGHTAVFPDQYLFAVQLIAEGRKFFACKTSHFEILLFCAVFLPSGRSASSMAGFFPVIPV